MADSEPPPPDRHETVAENTNASPEPAAEAAAEETKPKKTKEEKETARLLKKERKAFKKAHRPLDAWERYRALTDSVKMAQDLVDLADHKVRFALIIMGAVNASFYILGTRTGLLGTIPLWLQNVAVAFLVGYALLVLFFFFQAIDTLRPRKAAPRRAGMPDAPPEMHDQPLGVRYFEDVLQRDLDGYRVAWQKARVDQLNAELTAQAYALAHINRQKYAALRRLYFGLKVMIACSAVMIGTLGLLVYREAPQERAAIARARHHGRRSLNAGILGQPTRFADLGTSEPTGVAYHPALARLYVVGAEGRVSELDLEGKLLHTDKVRGNVEDLAVHAPTGQLVMIAEKTSELVLWDPKERREVRRWELDRASLLGEEPTSDRKHAFAGITFRQDAGVPAGMFYLVHEREPEVLVGAAFDVGAPAGKLEPAVVSRWKLDERNLKSALFLPGLSRVLVLSAKKGIVVLKLDGSVESEIVLPGDQDEGFCLDGVGNLWVADGRGKALLRFNGALQALTAAIRTEEDVVADPQVGAAQPPSPTPHTGF